MKIYQHRQYAKAMIIALGLAAIVCFIMAAQIPGGFIGLAVGIILLICLVVFSSLSVEVTEEHLSWHFGLGLIRKQVLLSEINTAKTTRTKLIEGWGIRFTTRGWLYNVSGFDAVIISMKDGKQFLLGTDEPEKLAAVLQAKKTSAS